MYWRNKGIIFAHKRDSEICSSVSYLRVSTGKQAQADSDYPKERGAVMAEASQDSRPSDGKRGATPNARRYPRADPAEVQHTLPIAGRSATRKAGVVERRSARREACSELAACEGRRIPVDFRGDSAHSRRS
jgi:hypothetical protein